MQDLKVIYNKIHSHFGPQGWWPVTKEGKLIPEYSGGPKNEKQQLEVIFGSILAQNTGWKNAEKAIIELNKNNLISAEKIKNIDNKKLAKIIMSSGYHSQKAKKLKNFCDFLFKNYNGNLKNLFENDINRLRQELLSINGVGPETADSIMLYAAKKPIFVIDTYTKRIFSRIGYLNENAPYEEWQKLFHKELQRSTQLYNEYHALLVKHAKRNCMKKPVCEGCVLDGVCKRRINHTKDYI
jgi:endonuclease-3 related protein